MDIVLELLWVEKKEKNMARVSLTWIESGLLLFVHTDRADRQRDSRE